MKTEIAPGFTGRIVAPSRYSFAESSEHYAYEIERLGKFRIIECSDRVQWIIQRRIKPQNERAGKRWKAIGYFMTREALAHLWHAKTGAALVAFDHSISCSKYANQRSGNSALRSIAPATYLGQDHHHGA